MRVEEWLGRFCRVNDLRGKKGSVYGSITLHVEISIECISFCMDRCPGGGDSVLRPIDNGMI